MNKTNVFRALGMILLCNALPCHGHHIRGIPHYTYSENYPTAPAFEEVRESENLTLRMTYWDIPGTRAVDLALYAKDRHTGKPFKGTVEFAVYGEDEDPAKAHSVKAYMNKNNIFKAGWSYEEFGLYRVRVRIYEKDQVIEETYSMQIGDAGISWLYVGGSFLSVMLLIILVAVLKKISSQRTAGAAPDSGAGV